MLGKKLGMTSIFNEKGQVIPVTVIEAGPVTVMQVKTPDQDGYAALQVGFGEKKLQRAKKAELGHAKKAGASPKRTLREIGIEAGEVANFTRGQILGLADVGLAAGDLIDVIGTSIGKGFQGTMKKYNFAGYPASHGSHEYKRHSGSIGTNTTPGRVLKNTKMPGQMGNARVTVQSLTVVEVRPEENLILVLGAVPGHKNGVVTIQFAKKKKLKKGAVKAA